MNDENDLQSCNVRATLEIDVLTMYAYDMYMLTSNKLRQEQTSKKNM